MTDHDELDVIAQSILARIEDHLTPAWTPDPPREEAGEVTVAADTDEEDADLEEFFADIERRKAELAEREARAARLDRTSAGTAFPQPLTPDTPPLIEAIDRALGRSKD